MEFTLFGALVLIAVGIVAGFINILAGGGSNLTLPALMVLGLPPEVANGTNRIAICLQCIAGALGFQHHGKLESGDAQAVTIPVILGALIGSLLASYFPSAYLKPALLGTMLLMAFMILVAPQVIIPEVGERSHKVSERPIANVLLFATGVYGGFVQAGVGFLLIAALAGTLRYDLVRSNALKLVCNLAITVIALVVFVFRDQVQWLPGLILAVGTMVGAYLGVKVAIKASAIALKWFVFLMTLVACGAALFS